MGAVERRKHEARVTGRGHGTFYGRRASCAASPMPFDEDERDDDQGSSLHADFSDVSVLGDLGSFQAPGRERGD